MGRGRSAGASWADRKGAPIIPAAFALGLAIGLAHQAVSLEIGVSLTYHKTFIRTIFLALYPLGVFFMGIGAVLERRLRDRVPSPVVIDASLRAAGVSLLAYLALALRVNFFVTAPLQLVFVGALHLAALGAWFLSLGAAIASVLRAARRREDPGWVGSAWAVHMAGLLAGYAATDFLVHAVGPNAVLVAIAVSLVVASRAAPLVLAAVLAAAPVLSLDSRLERLRNMDPLTRGEIQSLAAPPSETMGSYLLRLHQGTREVLFQGWSRFGHVQLERMEKGELRGFYNHVPQWEVEDPAEPDKPLDVRWRAALYGVLRPAQKILILAAGGGRGLSSLPFAPHKGVTAVELNETVVRVLSDEHPDFNFENYRRATALAAEARFAADTTRERFDAVLVESGRFHTAQMLAPAGTPQSLYTRESIQRYLSRLRPGGLLLVVFDDILPKPWQEYFPLQVLQTLSESGVPFRVLSIFDSTTTSVVFAASSDPEVLERVRRAAAKIGSFGFPLVDWHPQTRQAPCHRVRLTDDQPFAHWYYLPGFLKRYVLFAAGLLAGVATLAALWLSRIGARTRRSGGPPLVSFFFLIGAAQVMMMIAVSYAFRSFLGDPVVTTIRLTSYLLLYGAAGSLASRRLAGIGRPRLFALAAGLMGLHAAALAAIPFEAASTVLREAFAALALAPGGVLMGALFPAAVLSAGDDDLDRCLLADALGSVAGYAACHLILLPLGVRAFLAASFLLYAAALAAFPMGASETSSR